jgi:hypothetical protein
MHDVVNTQAYDGDINLTRLRNHSVGLGHWWGFAATGHKLLIQPHLI